MRKNSWLETLPKDQCYRQFFFTFRWLKQMIWTCRWECVYILYFKAVLYNPGCPTWKIWFMLTLNWLFRQVKLLSEFDAPFNERYNYGQRLKTYFVAPMTGDYRFVMACDRRCELWMSPTEHAAHKKRVLRQTRLTARHQFDRWVFGTNFSDEYRKRVNKILYPVI